MDNQYISTEIVPSNTVSASYSLKDVVLHKDSYHDIWPQNCELISIVYCEVGDFRNSLTLKDKMISIHMDFNLLVLYEYMVDGNKDYGLYVDKIHRDIIIYKKLYGLPKKILKCESIINDIEYITDLDTERNILDFI